MLRNKLLPLVVYAVLSIFLGQIITPVGASCSAITLDELTQPKEPAYRLGIEQVPEKIFRVKESKHVVETKEADFEKRKNNVKNLTYADLSLKKIAKEISDDSSFTEADVLEDIKLLWVGAAQNSETVKFIVYKLSNPDEDKPNESIVKKIIRPISTVGSLAGIGLGSPVAAISSIMGSSILGSMSVDDKDLNYRFSKVNDADMIVLIRKIEELQRKIVHNYFDYMIARQSLIKSEEIVNKRKQLFLNSQNRSDEQLLMIDSFYRASLSNQAKLRSDFLSKRSALEQMVGADTLLQFESIIENRK